jgi:hypothetical protein
MPQSHKDTKVHKEFIFNDLSFVLLRAFVPLPTGRQVGGKKILFWVGSTFQHFNFA